MIVDFHTHMFPPAIAQRALSSLSQSAGGIPCYTDGTRDALLAHARAAGVDVCVALPVATNARQMRRLNEAALACQRAPLISFGAVYPLAPDAAEEVAWIAAQGIRGVKLHPEYQGFDADDPRVFPVYEAIGRAGLVTVFHAGYDLAYDGEGRGAPDKIKRALAHFHGAPVVAAHLGGSMDWRAAQALVGDRRVYLDTSFSFGHIPLPAMARMVREHGAQRVLFGSDSPWSPMAREIALARSLGLSPAEEAAVLGGNAARLLGL